MGQNIWQSLKGNWKYDVGTQVATLSVLTATFVVLSLALLVHQNIEAILSGWGNEVKVSVYLDDQAQATELEKVEEQIRSTDLFSNVEFVSKSAAANRFKSRMGEIMPDLLRDMEFENPLPASYELQVAEGVRTTGSFQSIVEFAGVLRDLAGVEEVSYGQGWVENYASVIRVFSYSSFFFALVLLSGGLFVVGNSIRNSLAQRKEEIEILELFGATRSSILRPYLYEGVLMGFCAAILALFVSYALYSWQQNLFESELSFWFLRVQLSFLNIYRILMLLALGGTLGGLASYLWVKTVNSGWSAAEASSRWKK